MKNQSLINRITTLELNNQDKLQNRQLNKFIKSLNIEDQKKFISTCGVIVFEGQPEDFNRIIKPFGETVKFTIIDNII